VLSPTQDIVIACADVGTVAKGNFGWWSSLGESGNRPSALAEHLSAALNAGRPVALGFECPLFAPLLDDELCLTKARPGEGSRPWSAGAGCGALTTGLVQTAWVLREIRKQLVHPTSAFLSWPAFCASGSGLFLWEAFVSDNAKGISHTDDARLGVEAFAQALPDPMSINAITCSNGVYSFIGAALLRTGWSDDLHLLQEPCLVVRAHGAKPADPAQFAH
jgi:hypothetical protein